MYMLKHCHQYSVVKESINEANGQDDMLNTIKQDISLVHNFAKHQFSASEENFTRDKFTINISISNHM